MYYFIRVPRKLLYSVIFNIQFFIYKISKRPRRYIAAKVLAVMSLQLLLLLLLLLYMCVFLISVVITVPIYQPRPPVTVKLTSEVPVWKRKLKLFLTKILRQLIILYGTGQEISFKCRIWLRALFTSYWVNKFVKLSSVTRPLFLFSSLVRL